LIDAAETLEKEIAVHRTASRRKGSPDEVRELHAVAVAVKRRQQDALRAEWEKRVIGMDSPLLEWDPPARRPKR